MQSKYNHNNFLLLLLQCNYLSTIHLEVVLNFLPLRKALLVLRDFRLVPGKKKLWRSFRQNSLSDLRLTGRIDVSGHKRLCFRKILLFFNTLFQSESDPVETEHIPAYQVHDSPAPPPGASSAFSKRSKLFLKQPILA